MGGVSFLNSAAVGVVVDSTVNSVVAMSSVSIVVIVRKTFTLEYIEDGTKE